MKNQALQYYMHDGPTAFRFELAGNLNQQDARRLEQAWRTASSVIGDRRLIVDMTFVTGVDEQGRALITRWHREGARLIASSKASRALAESILGKPLPEPPTNVGGATVSDRTWLPFRASFLGRALTLPLLVTIMLPGEANAATSKSETVTACLPASRQVPNNSAAFQHHFRIRAPHLLEFIDSVDWNTTCLQ
jgi:hypothetical protein